MFLWVCYLSLTQLSSFSSLDMENHRAELVSLAEKDPEFFKFLEEQETDLLEFNESDYEADETEERGGEEEGETVG